MGSEMCIRDSRSTAYCVDNGRHELGPKLWKICTGYLANQKTEMQCYIRLVCNNTAMICGVRTGACCERRMPKLYALSIGYCAPTAELCRSPLQLHLAAPTFHHPRSRACVVARGLPSSERPCFWQPSQQGAEARAHCHLTLRSPAIGCRILECSPIASAQPRLAGESMHHR